MQAYTVYTSSSKPLQQEKIVGQTVCSIDTLHALHVEKSSVQTSIKSKESITCLESQAMSIETMNNLFCKASTISQRLSAWKDLSAQDCPRLGPVIAHGRTTINNCPQIESVFAAGRLQLQHSTVIKDVRAQADTFINASTIQQTLYCTSSTQITHSNIDSIVVSRPTPSSSSPPVSRSSVCVHIAQRSYSATAESPRALQRPTLPSEQALILSECHVRQITFEKDGGKVILLNGSTVEEVLGATIQD